MLSPKSGGQSNPPDQPRSIEEVYQRYIDPKVVYHNIDLPEPSVSARVQFSDEIGTLYYEREDDCSDAGNQGVNETPCQAAKEVVPADDGITRTRSGREVRLPSKYEDYVM